MLAGAERSGQRLGQRRDLPAQPAPGQLGQVLGVPFTGDHLLQDRPAGHTQQLGGHRRQFHPGVLHQLLQPLHLTGLLLHDRTPRPGEVPQVPERLRRDERRADQAMHDEIHEPRGVRHIRFPTRYVTHMSGVEKPAFELVLQHVESWFPVNPCGYHSHDRDLVLGQPVREEPQRTPGRGERSDLDFRGSFPGWIRTAAATVSRWTSSPAQRGNTTSVSTSLPNQETPFRCVTRGSLNTETEERVHGSRNKCPSPPPPYSNTGSSAPERADKVPTAASAPSTSPNATLNVPAPHHQGSQPPSA